MKIPSILKAVGAVALAMPALGWLYQAMASQVDRRRYPPPGELVDVGGYRLHIYGLGTQHAGPSVILDAGLGCTCMDWDNVQGEIAAFARVYSYDRAGFGWSDGGPRPRSSRQMVEELHRLLENAHVAGPYVLVGHSFGGFNVRLFADTYPQEVAGLVLVDTSHEDQLERIMGIQEENQATMRVLRLCSIVSPFGLMRVAVRAGLTPLDKLAYSAGVLPVVKALVSQTRYPASNYQELAAFPESAGQVRASRRMHKDLPVIALSQRVQEAYSSLEEERSAQIWQEFQRDQVTLSTNGRQVVAGHSGHYIQLEQPELVIEAIKSIVTSHVSEKIDR